MVLVMPSGSMFPHGSPDFGCGSPTCVDHTTAPVVAFRAYTVSCSVAAYTRSPITSGWPYTAPSRAARQATDSGPSGARSGATPVRALSWWYVIQSWSSTGGTLAAGPDATDAAGPAARGPAGSEQAAAAPQTTSRARTARSAPDIAPCCHAGSDPAGGRSGQHVHPVRHHERATGPVVHHAGDPDPERVGAGSQRRAGPQRLGTGPVRREEVDQRLRSAVDRQRPDAVVRVAYPEEG